MINFIMKRLGIMILTALCLTFIVFFLTNLEPFSVVRMMDWMRTIESDQVSFADYPTMDDAHWPRAPVAAMAELANVLDVDLWLNMPHDADGQFAADFAKNGKEGELRLAISDWKTGDFLGVIGLRAGEEHPEIGYWLAREYWGMGVMKEAAAALQFPLASVPTNASFRHLRIHSRWSPPTPRRVMRPCPPCSTFAAPRHISQPENWNETDKRFSASRGRFHHKGQHNQQTDDAAYIT